MSIFKQNKESTRLHRTILHPIKNYRAFKKQSINYVNARAKYIKQHEKEYDHNSSKQAQNSLRLVAILLLIMLVILCCLKLISKL